MLLKTLQTLHEKNCWSLFLINLQVLFYQKRLHGDLHGDSNAGVFLLNLQNLQEHIFVQNNSGGCFSRLILRIMYNVFYSVFCNFRKFLKLIRVRCLYATKHLFNFQVSNWWFQLYVAYFLNPLIEDYLEFFDTPAPVHSNYTLSLTREKKGKGKRWKKNSI